MRLTKVGALQKSPVTDEEPDGSSRPSVTTELRVGGLDKRSSEGTPFGGLRVLDMFSGLGGMSAAFRDRGHHVDTLDFDARFKPTFCQDVRDFHPKGKYDVVVGGPDCRRFSVAALARHWKVRGAVHYPTTMEAEAAVDVVRHAKRVILESDPEFWILENPRGKLRSLGVLAGYRRRTVTYCQYGASWQKATDLWGVFPPALQLKRPCKARDSCHDAAPRGSKTGVQGVRDPALRALFPYALSLEICLAAEKAFAIEAAPSIRDETTLGARLASVKTGAVGVGAGHLSDRPLADAAKPSVGLAGRVHGVFAERAISSHEPGYTLGGS